MTLYLSQTGLLLLITVFFILGFVLGAAYDILRLIKGAIGPKSRARRIVAAVFINLSDILFFVFTAAVFAISFYACNDGKVRPSAFIAGALGLALYRHTLSRPFQKLVRCIFNLVVLLLRIILRPPALLLKALLSAISAHIRKKSRCARSKRAVKRLLSEAATGFEHSPYFESRIFKTAQSGDCRKSKI